MGVSRIFKGLSGVSRAFQTCKVCYKGCLNTLSKVLQGLCKGCLKNMSGVRVSKVFQGYLMNYLMGLLELSKI